MIRRHRAVYRLWQWWQVVVVAEWVVVVVVVWWQPPKWQEHLERPSLPDWFVAHCLRHEQEKGARARGRAGPHCLFVVRCLLHEQEKGARAHRRAGPHCLFVP